MLRSRLPLVAVAGVLLAPLAVLVVRVLVDDAAAPGGDVGLIELRVRDVGTAHHPLLGSYSRFGFNQPGPALLYLLAVPYRLAGGRFAGLEMGAILLSAVALVVILSIAWRRAGTVGVVGTGAVLAVFVHGLGPAWLADPWEPHVLVPLGAALVVLAADAVAGRVRTLPVVALVASVIAQAWPTMLPFALALGLWAVAGLVPVARRPGGRRAVVQAAVAAAVVIAVVWAPPLVEQLTQEPGNVTAMLETFGAPEATLGPAGAWRVVAIQLGHRAMWLGFDQQLEGLSSAADLAVAPIVPIGLLALLAGAFLARRHPGARALVATVIVAVAVAWVSMTRLIPPVFAWIPPWLQAVAVPAALAAGAAAWVAVPAGRRRVARPIVVAAGAVVLVGVSGVTIGDVLGDWREPDRIADAVRALAAPGAEEVAGVDGPVLVRSRVDANLAFGGDDVAPEVLVLALERRGIETVVDADAANRFGARRARPDRAERELRLITADDTVPEGFEVVATADPLGDEGRRRRERLLAEAGLPPDATVGEVIAAVAADPSRRRLGPALRDLPDLPRISLLVGPASV